MLVEKIIRWTARILSLLIIVILLMFLFGEGDFSEIGKITLEEWVGVLFFPLGVVVGMIIGWWREGLGGAIAVGSLLVFYLFHLIGWRDLPSGPFFILFTLPGFLFLLCWFLSRRREQQATV